jgi:hypothetical protein
LFKKTMTCANNGAMTGIYVSGFQITQWSSVDYDRWGCTTEFFPPDGNSNPYGYGKCVADSLPTGELTCECQVLCQN